MMRKSKKCVGDAYMALIQSRAYAMVSGFPYEVEPMRAPKNDKEQAVEESKKEVEPNEENEFLASVKQPGTAKALKTSKTTRNKLSRKGKKKLNFLDITDEEFDLDEDVQPEPSNAEKDVEDEFEEETIDNSVSVEVKRSVGHSNAEASQKISAKAKFAERISGGSRPTATPSPPPPPHDETSNSATATKDTSAEETAPEVTLEKPSSPAENNSPLAADATEANEHETAPSESASASKTVVAGDSESLPGQSATELDLVKTRDKLQKLEEDLESPVKYFHPFCGKLILKNIYIVSELN